MIEDELRASFARHEFQAPGVGPLRRAIDRLAARRRRRRNLLRTGGAAALVLVALIAVPLGLRPGPAMTMLQPLYPTSDLAPTGPLNLVLIGLDPYPDHATDRPRADTIILAHLTSDRQRAYLISFERDLAVDIPGFGTDKINMAYVNGGAPLLATVVSSLTGVPVNGTVTVNLSALAQIVDTLGGLPLCQPVAVTSIHTGRTFPVGCYQLDGAGVTDLVRQRHDYPTGGYFRDRVAQGVLISLLRKVVLIDIGQLAALTRVDGVDIDLPFSPVSLALAAKDLGADDVLGFGQPSFDPVGTNERLDPEVAPELFAALRSETLDDFAVRHPDWLVTNH
jgi:LCP family protein required for cell wall assembly